MRRFLVLCWIVMLLGSSFNALAQTRGGVCPGVVNQALADLGTNCANMDRNSACYGFNNVEASFNIPVAPDFFTQPNDRAELLAINALKTGRLDLLDDRWGVSLLNVQANLPDALPGQSVVFVLLGGVEVEGDVRPEDAVIPAATLQVTVTGAAELLNVPDAPGWNESPAQEGISVHPVIPVGTRLSADAVDSTGAWVRVVYNDKPGWISTSLIGEDVSSLTVLTPDSRTPMQAFFFRVGIGGVSCEDVPSLLAVQGPRNTAIDIEVDRINVRVTSTIVLQTFPPGDTVGDILQLSVISGLAIINPGQPNEFIIPAGYTAFIRLAPDLRNLGIEGDTDEKLTVGEWSAPRPLTPEELAQLDILEGVPGNLLHYPIDVPTSFRPSTVGSPTTELVFSDQGALDGARRACAAGLLASDVCATLGL